MSCARRWTRPTETLQWRLRRAGVLSRLSFRLRRLYDGSTQRKDAQGAMWHACSAGYSPIFSTATRQRRHSVVHRDLGCSSCMLADHHSTLESSLLAQLFLFMAKRLSVRANALCRMARLLGMQWLVAPSALPGAISVARAAPECGAVDNRQLRTRIDVNTVCLPCVPCCYMHLAPDLREERSVVRTQLTTAVGCEHRPQHREQHRHI